MGVRPAGDQDGRATMAVQRLSLAVLGLLAMLAPPAAGHGMLIEPVNRGSMWRYGYDTPPNYTDNEQYCGGRTVQWVQNGGRCGECGDNWALPRPRAAENGGKYGTGISVATYKSGQVITAKARLSANHAGGFEFRLCPLKDSKELEAQECFDQHLIKTVNGETFYKIPAFQPGDYSVSLQLPGGVTCELCVLQWTYITGNTWGTCEDGSQAEGCGPQETFRTCSDVTIV